MPRSLVVSLVLALAVLIASGKSFGPHVALAGVDTVVSNGGSCPQGLPAPAYTTISDAVTAAGANDVIFVCDGTYSEPAITLGQSGMQLLGPGSTPEDDGVATITKANASSSTVVISAADVTFSGFTVDATPTPGFGSWGIEVRANSAVVSDNIVTGANGTTFGLSVGDAVPPDNVQVLRNHFSGNETSNGDLACDCRHGIIDSNVFTSGGADYLQVTQDNVTFQNNLLTGTKATINSDGAVIHNNMFDFTGTSSFPLQVRGESVSFALNQVMNVADDYGLLVAQMEDGPTSVSILQNTFTSIAGGIVARDGFDDAFGVTLTIGGAPADSNTFVDSGKALGDGYFLLDMADVHENASAEYNDWGLCSLSDIEQEINDGADAPGIGVVDYDPFVASNCPSATPTATPSTTPTPTQTSSATPSATSSATASPTALLGDADCDGFVTMDDVIAVLSELADVPPGAPCASNVGCEDPIDAQDALDILAFVASPGNFPFPQC